MGEEGIGKTLLVCCLSVLATLALSLFLLTLS